MNIDNLKKDELKKLKKSINNRIKKIKQDKKNETKRKDSVKDKTKLSQLTSNDTIYVIEIFYSAINNRMEIRSGYKDIINCKKCKDNNGFHFSYGGTSTWISDEDADNHYVIDMHVDNYFAFCTMKPELYTIDISKAKFYFIENKIKQHQKEIMNYEKLLSEFDRYK
jgi:hypothetical protein